MGWRDRDWAKFTEEEKKALWGGGERSNVSSTWGRGSGAPPPRRRGGRSWGVAPFAWLAALISLALFAAGQLPRGNPLLPPLSIDLPGIGSAQARKPQVMRLNGPKVVRQGGVFTVSGSAGSGEGDAVRIDVHWNARPWENVYTGPLGPGGSYQAAIPLTGKGTLSIRVLLPGGDQVRGSIRVVP